MKFLKKFKELHESKEGQKELFFIYTTCDDTYGGITWNISNDFPEEHLIDDEPCNFSTDGYIISEDEENSEKEREILAKQTGGVWDKNYNYDYDEAEVVAWRNKTIDAWIDQYMGSDLWGSVYLLSGDLIKEYWHEQTTDLGKYNRMPTKKEFEADELTDSNGIESWVDVGGSEGSNNIKKMSSAFCDQLQNRPVAIASILNSMKKSLRERVISEMGKNPDIDIKNLRSVMKALEIGLM